ncbi:MAG: DUF6789 family protein [Thermomicrobiales bacterium]
MATRFAIRNNSQAARVERRADWLPDSLLSGFVATIVMSAGLEVAFGISRALGDQHGNFLEKWLWALTHNPVIDTTQNRIAIAIGLNLLMGLLFAVVYGYYFEQRLAGSGWQKGMVFSLFPWILSVIAFLPIMGGGFLGKDIDAGPLPVVGNLILHLIYGAVLGWMYMIDIDDWLDGSDADHDYAEAAERGAIGGVLVGLLAGGVIGWAASTKLDDLGSKGTITLVSALVGSAMCALLGSFYGMERVKSDER